ncbi:hypothetical protein M427DRAFT_438773 [Gonapodya prolifera JEL478]|uniref:Cyclin N-terminal domain-containing protein n=1 Tax=Gonapodya prolifera (strain JEL478) TaxID=1344416 RepID=A0A139A3U2_GONPJ|nr:hypothetical protein M427DRAFT_438773 [Gonapodya prolifera JEL478]|eukprot:KXS11339.1 hypothetical protein M427DRAFT_438773 [Gonapodya prolifera JEL478]
MQSQSQSQFVHSPLLPSPPHTLSPPHSLSSHMRNASPNSALTPPYLSYASSPPPIPTSLHSSALPHFPALPFPVHPSAHSGRSPTLLHPSPALSQSDMWTDSGAAASPLKPLRSISVLNPSPSLRHSSHASSIANRRARTLASHSISLVQNDYPGSSHNVCHISLGSYGSPTPPPGTTTPDSAQPTPSLRYPSSASSTSSTFSETTLRSSSSNASWAPDPMQTRWGAESVHIVLPIPEPPHALGVSSELPGPATRNSEGDAQMPWPSDVESSLHRSHPVWPPAGSRGTPPGPPRLTRPTWTDPPPGIGASPGVRIARTPTGSPGMASGVTMPPRWAQPSFTDPPSLSLTSQPIPVAVQLPNPIPPPPHTSLALPTPAAPPPPFPLPTPTCPPHPSPPLPALVPPTASHVPVAISAHARASSSLPFRTHSHSTHTSLAYAPYSSSASAAKRRRVASEAAGGAGGTAHSVSIPVPGVPGAPRVAGLEVTDPGTKGPGREDFVEGLLGFAMTLLDRIWPTPRDTDEGLFPLRVFISEMVRRSQSSFSTFELALLLCLRAWPKVAQVRSRHHAGDGTITPPLAPHSANHLAPARAQAASRTRTPSSASNVAWDVEGSGVDDAGSEWEWILSERTGGAGDGSFGAVETRQGSQTAARPAHEILRDLVAGMERGDVPFSALFGWTDDAPRYDAATVATPALDAAGAIPHPLLCARRVFLASLLLSWKYLHDKSYSNAAWSKISGLPVAEINRLEGVVLRALGWDVKVDEGVFWRWSEWVQGGWKDAGQGVALV